MGERDTGSFERQVVEAVTEADLDLTGESIETVRERLATETGSETWAAENAAPFYLMARVMALHERMAAVDGLPTVDEVESWREDLETAVGVADAEWGSPTVEIAAFVPEAAGELRSMLSTLAELVEEHRDHVADLGTEDSRVRRHEELVCEHLETSIRATRLFDRDDGR